MPSTCTAELKPVMPSGDATAASARATRMMGTLAKDKIEIPVACPVCREGNIHKMDLNDHFNKCHADLNSNCCVECFEVVKMEKGDELRKHILKNHQSSSHVQIQCSDCGKHFNGEPIFATLSTSYLLL